MRILITGANGMLGSTLRREWTGHDLIPTDLPDGDITNATVFDRLLRKEKPDVVVHCAAMTAVDRCETEPELAYLLNGVGSANVAVACRRNNARLIAISTDYVFHGDANRPYNEFDRPDPLTMYGKSKYAGEEAVRTLCPDHVIARIAWLYGGKGPSFVHSMLKLADGTRPVLKVVNDQTGNPTSTFAVAHALLNFIENPAICGTYHLTCEGEGSWYDFACEIFRLANVKQLVQPCTTAEFPRPAPRPANSRLDKMMLRLQKLPAMPDWKEALKESFSRDLVF